MKRKKIKISVIGAGGYVGLVTAIGFADLGFQTKGIEIDQKKVLMLNQGKSSIFEEGLEIKLKKNLKEKRIFFTSDYREGLEGTKVIFIAVGTPSLKNGGADLCQVVSVAEKIRDNLKNFALLVLKSTVPIGTCEAIKNILGEKLKEGKDFEILVNPEFLREGKGLDDFFSPSRIIIGGGSKRAKRIMKEIYFSFIKRKVPYLETDINSAQLIKYASNAFLAARISFINEIAILCEKLKADIGKVREGMGYDPRIGKFYLEPGIGFGGPCLEKDLKALLRLSQDVGYEPDFLQGVLDRNEKQVKIIISKIKELTGPVLFKKPITIFGLTFKAGTNDVRNSLSLRIIEALKRQGAEIKTYDPVGKIEEREGIKQFFSPYEATEGSFCIAILTEWEEFKKLDYKKIREKMFSPNIVDGKNILDSKKMKKLGYNCLGIGKI